MELENIKSNLRMENFYFSECSITREASFSQSEYRANLEKEVKQIEDHVYEVTLITTIEKSDVHIHVTAKATFHYESNDYSTEETVMNVNTVAIMFPFIRSEVSLLTSQPGMPPIVLPAINALKMYQ